MSSEFNPTSPDYLNPAIAANLPRQQIPIVDGTDESLAGYGKLVDNVDDIAIEIVRWPAQGWRPVDTDCGDEGGTVEGIFHSDWRGDILYGRNDAVEGNYILGYNSDPASATDGPPSTPLRILLWHANYHPDGGQLFFPLQAKPFVLPLALPGDDIKPSDFVCFRFDGSQGVYIHPNIWHEGAFSLAESQSFFDKQGAVHARVSVDFPREFGCLLEVIL
jgi:hypothetical protein